MNLKQQRAAALKAAQEIVAKAKAESRDLTDDERTEVQAKTAEIADLDAKIKAADDSAGLMSQIESLGGGSSKSDDDEKPARSISEHFVKSLKGRPIKSLGKFETPEFKASTDPVAVGGSGLTSSYGPLVTDVDRSFVLPYRRPLVVADLLGTGNVSGNSITYPVYASGVLDGGVEMVAEGGQKQQFSNQPITWMTDALGEVAGWFKITDDMSEDLPYVVSEIENAARYDLLLKEETQLLNGSGTAPNLRGILQRSGIQTHTQTTEETADAIFHALTLVQQNAGFVADGIVINPLDYEKLRLNRDGNGQYFGGGYFQGQYGNGAVMTDPPLWSKTTVVTAAVEPGTVVVGAFKAAASVFRKGGLRVESTNSHDVDFTNDQITIRLRERIGLQVKYPKAIVKVTLASGE